MENFSLIEIPAEPEPRKVAAERCTPTLHRRFIVHSALVPYSSSSDDNTDGDHDDTNDDNNTTLTGTF